MKIVHIESGLGNQMLSYCEYLALKEMDPNDEIYIETIIYDIPECNDIICQWNGYELERIFKIDAPNIKDVFSEEQWKHLIQTIRKSEFWKKNWNYPVWFSKAFNENGIHVRNIRGNFEEPSFVAMFSNQSSIRRRLIDNKIGDFAKRIYYRITENKKLQEVNNKQNIFLEGDSGNVFTGQWLSFKFRNNGIERIDSEIRRTFVFPDMIDSKNIRMAEYLSNCNSVAIHARRGDMLTCNKSCYEYGYFIRAVRLIKKLVKNPVFIFFCDPGSVEWCKTNRKTFGLDTVKDRVMFVDWNKGDESYRDMQLMSFCKHAIITNSSFGWWGAYLIQNKEKITISPDIRINTTYHC